MEKSESTNSNLLFDNQIKESGVYIDLKFTIKKRKEIDSDNFTYFPTKIRSIDLETENLISSIIYNISISNKTDFSITFKLCLADITSIERLALHNKNINFNIQLYDKEKKFVTIPIAVSVTNLLTLNLSKVNQITKSLQGCLIDMDFNIHSQADLPEFTKCLLSKLETKVNNTSTNTPNNTFPMESLDESDSNSMYSEVSSSISSFNNSSLSLSSLANKHLHHNRHSHNYQEGHNRTPSSSSKKAAHKILSSRLISRNVSPHKRLSIKSGSVSTSDLSSSNPDLYHDDTDGFLILQIESATGLPPFRNSTKLGYDMDPFVVVSFSKQIFKTAVCRHALNPTWKNQLINIRVSKYSFNFQLKLSVYDFDFFTFNDDICSNSIEISNLINESEYNHSDSWTYKKLPLKFSSKSLAKKSLKFDLNAFQPELSIRFKYVSVCSLNNLPHDFNPKTTKCPNCHKFDKRNNSALQHLSICTLNLKPTQFLHKHYTTSNNASRRWYSKVLAHIAYGRLTVGGNNANILVQDRETGLVLEEKISAFVKLGIRLLYKSVKSDNSSEKIKKMLRLLSIKQGLRYDSVDSASKISGFVKFHGLQSTLDECLNPDLSSYHTFNDFFSRKLKPNARPVEGGVENNDIIASVADSRLVVFDNINNAKLLWIKGNGFTIEKLLGKKLDDQMDHSIAIFRLAPQDYHRVHCPLNGKILKITQIHGSYYTVNPMAVRSALDVFGENVRTVVQMETKEYGIVEIVLVGAMMVGSIIITARLDEEVIKGQELGYFKFGGSTVVLIFPKKSNGNIIEWDADLISNSNKKLETLVKVGMSVGHGADKPSYFRGVKREVSESERQEVIRRVTGIADEYQTGMGDNLKAKLGGMIDDVMSLKSVRRSSIVSSTTKENENSNGRDMPEDWEIRELTTLDGLNDGIGPVESQSDVEVEIAIAKELEEDELHEMLDSSHDDSSGSHYSIKSV